MTSGGLAAVSSSFFAALYSAFGKYDVVHIHAEGPAFFCWLPKMLGKRVVVTVHGIDWQREKWQSGLGSKFIHQGEKNAVKYADEIIVLSKGVQKYFMDTYGRKTHFIPNVYSEQKAWDLQRSHWTSGTVYHVLKNEKYKGTYVGAKFIMPVPCKHRVLRAPLEQQVRIEDSHAAIVTPEEFEQAQMVIMLQHGKHQAGNYTKHQYPLKGKVYCGYCQKLMKYRVLKKLGPSFNCRFSATAVDSPCKRIPISEELLEEIVRNALTVQIKQAEHVLEILHERERKALICFSALERQEEKLSAEKAELVKLRVALYEQYADGNMSKEEFIRQRDAYRVQEDDKMEQIQRLRTEKNQIFQPVKKDTDNLQAVMNTVGEAGDVMHLSQNVVETFIDRIEVFNDECVKIRFTFEDVLKSYEAE